VASTHGKDSCDDDDGDDNDNDHDGDDYGDE